MSQGPLSSNSHAGTTSDVAGGGKNDSAGIVLAARGPNVEMAWISPFAALQVLGFVIDAVWHGLVNPRFEAASRRDMATHLVTVRWCRGC